MSSEPSIPRRRFLALAFGWSAAGLAATLPLSACQPGGAPAASAPSALRVFSPAEWRTLDAAASRLAPAGAGRLGGGGGLVANAADALFAQAPARLQGELKQLLQLLEWAPPLSGQWGAFSALSPAAQDAVLASWEQSPLALGRQGFSALSKIATMLYYMDPRAWPAIGYPGPWIGRFDLGFGLDNQGEMAAPLNPNVFARIPT